MKGLSDSTLEPSNALLQLIGYIGGYLGLFMGDAVVQIPSLIFGACDLIKYPYDRSNIPVFFVQIFRLFK